MQVRTDAGEQVCCTIASQQWQKLFHQTYGFFDQKMTLCPPIKCVRLIVPEERAGKGDRHPRTRETRRAVALADGDHHRGREPSVRVGPADPAAEGQTRRRVPLSDTGERLRAG